MGRGSIPRSAAASGCRSCTSNTYGTFDQRLSNTAERPSPSGGETTSNKSGLRVRTGRSNELAKKDGSNITRLAEVTLLGPQIQELSIVTQLCPSPENSL